MTTPPILGMGLACLPWQGEAPCNHQLGHSNPSCAVATAEAPGPASRGPAGYAAGIRDEPRLPARPLGAARLLPQALACVAPLLYLLTSERPKAHERPPITVCRASRGISSPCPSPQGTGPILPLGEPTSNILPALRMGRASIQRGLIPCPPLLSSGAPWCAPRCKALHAPSWCNACIACKAPMLRGTTHPDTTKTGCAAAGASGQMRGQPQRPRSS
jgi:hypothetical protein